MALKINGTAINFAFAAADGATITGITGHIQNVKWTKDADREEYKDATGYLTSEAIFNEHDMLELEILVTGTNLAGAITNSNPPAAGSFFPITVCAALPNLVSNFWRCMPGSSISGSNVDAKRINVTLRKDAGITATAT